MACPCGQRWLTKRRRKLTSRRWICKLPGLGRRDASSSSPTGAWLQHWQDSECTWRLRVSTFLEVRYVMTSVGALPKIRLDLDAATTRRGNGKFSESSA